MIGFLKAVLIGVAVYYVIGFISRLLAPFFIRMFIRKVSRKFEEQMNRRTQNQKTKKINLESFVVAEKTCRVRGMPPLM